MGKNTNSCTLDICSLALSLDLLHFIQRQSFIHFLPPFPKHLSFKKPKSSDIHLVTQSMNNTMSYTFHQHDCYQTFYKQNTSMCACVSLLLWWLLKHLNVLKGWLSDWSSGFSFALRPRQKALRVLDSLCGWLLATVLFPSWTLVYFRLHDRWAHPDLKMQNLRLCQTIILC